ncbi:MAG: hypothetical protein QGH68_06275 [SAR324 cluster bacterium]|nr:hypothetical protein [SAR324 cluster bacterium]
MEHCRKWSASRIILFLEFPWVLTHFDITITLSSEELASFAKMRLSLANNVDTGERSVRAKQSRNPVSAENHVGGIYYKQVQPDRVGLLCATLSKECVRLRKMLSLGSGVSVEVVPLVVACLPLLLTNPENKLIFKGLEQSFFLEKSNDYLTKFVELPAFENFPLEHFVSDQLPLEQTPQTFRLLPVETVNTLSENGSDTDEINEQQNVDIVQNGITMESVLSEWKGLARSPQTGFWWDSSSKYRRLKQIKLWKNLAGALILTGVVASALFYYQLQQQRKNLQQNLSSLELKLENQILNSPFVLSAESEKHIEQLEILAKQLVQEAFWKQQTLQTLLSSIEGSWLEGFYFKDHNLRMELLTLEPVNAVDLFIKLSKMSETAHVQLKSQQKSSIKGHEVIRFTLAIELAPPTIKQTLNLNNQK